MPKTRMLVVDDARLVRMFVKKVFRQIPDIEIVEAEDGIQAQTLLQESEFDLVLCDWDMPQMSGHELLEWMRTHQDERLKTLPFVMVTSNGEKEKVVQAVKMGVSGYVVKPFSSNQLLRQVQDVLKKQDSDRQKPAAAAPEPLSTVQVRFQGGTVEVTVSNVSAKGMVGTMPVGGSLPSVLAPVLAELKSPVTKETVNIPGYVFRIESAEDSPRPKRLGLGVRFLEVDAKKRDFLVDYITRLR